MFPAKLRRTVALGALLGAGFATHASAAENDPAPVPRPDALNQPIQDGCQRNPAGLLTYTSPEWVYVYDYQDQYRPGVPRVAEGLVTHADSGTGDLPQSHNWYDFSSDIKPDHQYEYLLGGDPSVPADATGAGNFADNPAIVHVEWEEGTFPTWAWPTEGDREKAWGRWIWDCGHWEGGFGADPSDPGGSFIHDTDYFLPGTGQRFLGADSAIRGEQTELHPLEAVLDARNAPTVPAIGENETDAMISSDGTPSSADSSCAHDNPAPTPANSPTSFYGPDWTACVNTTPDRNPVNDRDYTTFIPAPPKPTPNASIRFRATDHNPPGKGPAELIAPAKNGVFVNIPFQGFGSNSETLAYGKSLFVGWTGATQFVPAHIQVVFRKLTIHHSLDDPTFDTSSQVPPGEWNLYSDINGDWALLNDYAPQLSAVNSGDVLDLNHTYDEHVPDGAPVHLVVRGRECDLPKINPCAATSEVAEDNDNPCTADITFSSVDAAVGEHTLKPNDPSCGSPDDPNWELTYDVRLISPAGKKKIGPGEGCFDVFPPETHSIRRKANASHGEIRLRGSARERNCASTHAKPRRVEVSVARRAGRRCRFLDSSGKLGRREPCRLRRYLPAQGRRHWRFAKAWPGSPGTYVISARAADRAGNIELPDRANTFRLRLRR